MSETPYTASPSHEPGPASPASVPAPSPSMTEAEARILYEIIDAVASYGAEMGCLSGGDWCVLWEQNGRRFRSLEHVPEKLRRIVDLVLAFDAGRIKPVEEAPIAHE